MGLGRKFTSSALVLLVLFVSSTAPAYAVSAGGKCSKAGALSGTSLKPLICKRVGKKLIWRKLPTTTLAPTTTTNLTIPSPILTNVAACKLKDMTLLSGGTLGFPRVPIRLPSTGKVRIGVIFADFADSVATNTTTYALNQYSPDLETYFSEMSYGRLQIELSPVHSWLRMPKNSTSYRLGRGEGGWLEVIGNAFTL